MDVAVVGSLNMDLVVQADRHPRPGETLPGTRLDFVNGGKGANQAVGAARLGVGVAMIGAVGLDTFGSQLADGLLAEGIDIAGLRRVEGTGTGTAVITVDGAGANSIVVVPGANRNCDAAWVRQHAGLITGARVLLVQLETTLEAVSEAVRIARQAGVLVVLDPAPAPAAPLPRELAGLVDYVVPNEPEATALTGIPVESIDGARAAAVALVRQGYRRAVVKLGGRGALLATADGILLYPGFTVQAVDTTAAGDAFSAGLAVSLVQGYEPEAAIRRANAVGALAVTRRGAQPSMPTAAELAQFLAQEGIRS